MVLLSTARPLRYGTLPSVRAKMQTINCKPFAGTQLRAGSKAVSSRARAPVRVTAVASPPKLVTTRSEEVSDLGRKWGSFGITWWGAPAAGQNVGRGAYQRDAPPAYVKRCATKLRKRCSVRRLALPGRK